MADTTITTNFNAAAQPNPAAALSLTTPTPDQRLVLGVNAQSHLGDSVKTVAKLRWEERCRKTAKTLNEERKRLVSALAAAETAHREAIEAIEPDPQFVEDLLTAADSLKPFWADARATNPNGETLGVKPTGRKAAKAADQPQPGVTVLDADRYKLSGVLRSGAHSIIGLSREFDLPQEVKDAKAKVTEAQAEITRVDRELAKVRDEMKRTEEVGELAKANTVLGQLASSDEGLDLLNFADSMVDAIAAEAGLAESSRQAGTVEGATRAKALTPRKVDASK